VVTGENLFHFFRRELMPLDMEDVVIIPLKAGNNHANIVSGCIYETLHKKGAGLVHFSPFANSV
jgi:hypothetical protein